MDKTLRRGTDPDEQQAETYRYWQSLPVGERLTAVWEAGEASYAFAAAFKGVPIHDELGARGSGFSDLGSTTEQGECEP